MRFGRFDQPGNDRIEGRIALLLRRHRKARIAVLGRRHGHQIGEQPHALGEGQGLEAGEPGFELRQVLRCGILRLPAEHALQMFDDRMKCARRMKRRAADRHPDVVLAGRLPQALHQAGLADPGFALDQHDLAAAAATAFPGPQQQPHLLLASDEGCRAPGPGRGKPALDIPRRQDAPGRHRLGEPLELIGPQILEVEVIAEHRARGRADDDLVRLRQGLQTRRQVRRLADDRGLRCGSFADLVADDHRSGGDADPHRELDPGGLGTAAFSSAIASTISRPARTERSASSSWARG